MSSQYHHGELPDALRAATAELVSERGPTGFSLREVARRAGVSHAAPKHHFGSAKGLLTSVAIEGFGYFGDAFEEAVASSTGAVDRLTRQGRAYVNAALQYPGHFGVMMQTELVDGDDAELQRAASRAFGVLVETLEAVRDELNPDLDVETASAMCWAAMHGLVGLSPQLGRIADRRATPARPLDEIVGRFTDLFISGFQAR